MTMRQMTFSIPEDVAESFMRSVPDAERSVCVTRVLRRLSRRGLSEAEWALAGAEANADLETGRIASDFSALADNVEEVWHDASSR